MERVCVTASVIGMAINPLQQSCAAMEKLFIGRDPLS
jgi:hypothetical protein